jgi:hypothetical protein
MIKSKIQFVLPMKWLMKKKYYIHLILISLLSCFLQAAPRIVLFFKEAQVPEATTITKKIQKPAQLAHYMTKGMIHQKTPMIEGIVAVYGGYMGVSDYNGELSFPRKHQKMTVTILITPDIAPITLAENTVLSWVRVPGAPAAMYESDMIYDQDTDEHYWQTRQVLLTEDISIPLSAITIIADPKNVIMHTEKIVTNDTANLIVPPLLVKKGMNVIENSLHMLTIRHLFKSIQTEENREPLKILTHILD